jgi:hypothetical protein
MEIPWGNVITATATVIAVVIANRLTFRRSSQEKIWDLRRQAYGLILSELATVERICERADEYIQEDEHRYFEGKYSDEDSAEIGEHMSNIEKKFSDDYLVLSESFIALYDRMRDEMRGDPYNDTPPERHASFSSAVRKGRPLLIAQARDEMAIGKSWLPWKLFRRGK